MTKQEAIKTLKSYPVLRDRLGRRVIDVETVTGNVYSPLTHGKVPVNMVVPVTDETPEGLFPPGRKTVKP